MNKIIPFVESLYGPDSDTVRHQAERYKTLDRRFIDHFGDRPRCYVSVPGRTEICGNHTDHNHGKVLAGAINLDMAAVAAVSEGYRATIRSEGYERPFSVSIDDLSVREEEKKCTEALIRGIAARLQGSGRSIAGFDACIDSSVLPGSGLSSSAAVEVLIGTIFNALFNNGAIQPEEIAKIGQYAENRYFGKPCGLMDQMACAVGGLIAMDFLHPEDPSILKLPFDFLSRGYALVIVDTKGNHLDLTDDYTEVPDEMRSVARLLGAETMRDVRADEFFKNISRLRVSAGDRAVLRAMHFIGENDRVARMADTLRNKDMREFIRLVRESGDSSFKMVQNIYSPRNVQSQGMSLALSLTERFLSGINDGACRVHGGGFAGAIQAFLPADAAESYVEYIEEIFGHSSAKILSIRSTGAAFIL